MAKHRSVLFTGSGSKKLPEPMLCDQLPNDSELLWIDISGKNALSEGKAMSARYAVPAGLLPDGRHGTSPDFGRLGDWTAIRAVAAHVGPGLRFFGQVLLILAGKNIVITIHEEEIAGIEALIETSCQREAIGHLGHGSFLASILDWHLWTYFQAAAAFEIEIERLENAVLDRKAPEEGFIPALQRLRRAASRLRRMLAPHRVIFLSLSRPDFAPDGQTLEARHYQALDARFASAMDTVENARELVMGSFQLFSSQTDLQTNQVMRFLTFVTVVTGVFAVIAGVLGMNFEEDFFKSSSGFWIALGGMAFVAVLAYVIGRRGKWF